MHQYPEKEIGNIKVMVKNNCFMHFNLCIGFNIKLTVTPAASLSGDDAVPSACLPAHSVPEQWPIQGLQLPHVKAA